MKPLEVFNSQANYRADTVFKCFRQNLIINKILYKISKFLNDIYVPNPTRSICATVFVAWG